MDYNTTWWYEVSDKYVDEYEALVNDSDRADYITKTPLKRVMRRNFTYQRYDEEKNITTKTYVTKENGITSEYEATGPNGMGLLIICKNVIFH